jgi:predicted transcriptional regulator
VPLGGRRSRRNTRGETLNFESPGVFFARLSERRWALLNALQTAGPLSQRELARRLGRDVKRVHEDAHALLDLGLIEREETGALCCPFADIHVDMHAAAGRGRLDAWLGSWERGRPARTSSASADEPALRA